MKALLRSAPVQAVLAFLLGVHIRIMLATIRWRHENRESFDPVLAGGGGAIGLLWHGRISLSLSVAPQWWPKKAKIFVSPSADGEFIARALAMNGFHTIRVSTAKKGDAAKARQAVGAVREAVDWVSAGGGLVLTPDGPRGPNEVIAPGALQIARRSGAPVYLMGMAATPFIQFDSWDRAMVALPFGRGAVVWDGPLYVAADADGAAIERLILEWSQRLSAATRRAEQMLQRRPH